MLIHYLASDANVREGRLRRLVRSSISGDLQSRLVRKDSVWPCVGGCERGIAYIPAMVRVTRKPSLYSLLEMFGLPFDDPFINVSVGAGCPGCYRVSLCAPDAVSGAEWARDARSVCNVDGTVSNFCSVCVAGGHFVCRREYVLESFAAVWSCGGVGAEL